MDLDGRILFALDSFGYAKINSPNIFAGQGKDLD